MCCLSMFVPNIYLIKNKCCFNVFVCLQRVFLCFVHQFTLFMFRCANFFHYASVEKLKQVFLPIFSIFNVKWAILWILSHSQSTDFTRNFTPELCFTQCSKNGSLTNWVKECFMGCNVWFPKKKSHLLIWQWTFISFSEPSLKTRALFW